jgi:hypothetical protein
VSAFAIGRGLDFLIVPALLTIAVSAMIGIVILLVAIFAIAFVPVAFSAIAFTLA